MSVEQMVEEKARQAKAVAPIVANMPTDIKNRALINIAEAIVDRREYILSRNSEDIEQARKNKLSEALIDRLLLNEARIEAMSESLRQVAALPDPVGEIIEGWKRPNGLVIQKVRVPLGVIGIIYEARPNVTVDSAALCLKAGNCVVLKGGSEALQSNIALTNVIKQAISEAGIPQEAVQLLDTPERAAAQHLMRLNQYIDVLIPRGGAGLIRYVMENATVPVIETGVGNCHVYVDASADLNMAEEIVFNAKCQRPSVCNAAETLLVHKEIASEFLPRVAKRLIEAGVEIRGCQETLRILPQDKKVIPATDEDWDTEYLDLILAVKVVSSLDEAIEHINRHGTKHTEAIVTRDLKSAQRFCAEVDAAAVFVNASTRFTDGFEFGLGAEIGISTQKLHARGPMGLRELTTYKYVIYGDGQVRK
ncbi:MAG: glutamate-5-semialdehyde dehydrogenase [Armatimonadota bacterium]|nr:glutamate-5-semialdehyde dehydrogenase [Armatimonadota bacterium]MCX7778170.1 glutamate-5-semialdehyde dehydrogenase [Armatimonadota bacterium]MDW8026572.1 glutamate-5-semialdehyde dehydrogenase [Armatimonadota bacterium]